jgi:hypothetical protein
VSGGAPLREVAVEVMVVFVGRLVGNLGGTYVVGVRGMWGEWEVVGKNLD